MRVREKLEGVSPSAILRPWRAVKAIPDETGDAALLKLGETSNGNPEPRSPEGRDTSREGVEILDWQHLRSGAFGVGRRDGPDRKPGVSPPKGLTLRAAKAVYEKPQDLSGPLSRFESLRRYSIDQAGPIRRSPSSSRVILPCFLKAKSNRSESHAAASGVSLTTPCCKCTRGLDRCSP